MKYYDVIQGSEEWLSLRRGKFTASTFGDLFMKETTAGYKNAIYKVVYEHLTNESPENYSNDWMQRGTELEPEARERYELETFNKVHNGGFFELNEFIGCSPDGYFDNKIIEIKCPKYSTMIEYLLDNKLPKIYEWQVYGNLWITGKDECDFFAYHPKLSPVILTIKKCPIRIEQLEEKLDAVINETKTILEKLK